MKSRDGFVSNSSSSSFVILKRHLTCDQLWKILHIAEEAKQFASVIRSDVEDADGWSIREDDTSVSGYTSMDNFSMHEFFEAIGVPKDAVVWDEY